jgi:hypothetical protein
MKQIENLLVTTMEECAEVQQDISKALRFGVDNHGPNTPLTTNGENIMTEFYQLTAMIMHLQSYNVLPTFSDEMITDIMQDKIKKVAKYQELSFELKTLEK